MESLQNRILGAWPCLNAKTPKELLKGMRTKLVEAYNVGRLRTAFDGICEVQLYPSDRHKTRAGEYAAFGGIKDQARNPASARLVRDDGAWLHFTLTVKWDGKENLTLLGYNFEFVFPEGHSPPFIRFDLNTPDSRTENEKRGMRSHLHTGSDDTGMQLPAPVMTPEELLELLVWGLRLRDTQKPRARPASAPRQ